MSQLNYPAISNNENRKRSSFWNGMGMDIGRPEEVREISSTLFRAPVARYEDESFLVNTYGGSQEPEGRLSLRAARKLLGPVVQEGEELVVRMLEAGASAENTDTYDATLEVQRLSDVEKQAIPSGRADPLMLEEIPHGMGYGKNYDFTIISYGDDYLVAGPDDIEYLDESN